MTKPLTVSANPPGSQAVVRPVGEVDWGTVALMRAAFDRALVDAADDALLVDLSGITFMDCAGLNVLLQARRDWGDRLCLYRPPASLRRILRALEMEDAFTFVTTPATARSDPGPSSQGPGPGEVLSQVSSADLGQR